MDQELFDELITAAFEGRMTEIAEFSGNMARDWQALREQLEDWSERAGYPVPQDALNRLDERLEPWQS